MKIKYLLFTFWLLIAFNVFGQDTYLISYDKYSNEKKVDDKNKIKVLTNINETVIGTENSFNSQKNYPNEISYFNKKKPTLLTYITQFDSIHSITSNDSLIINKPVFKITKETHDLYSEIPFPKHGATEFEKMFYSKGLPICQLIAEIS